MSRKEKMDKEKKSGAATGDNDDPGQDGAKVENLESAENQDSTEGTIQALQQQYDELQDKYLRLYAEFDNFKRRTIKEKLDLIKSAGQDILTSLLPVLDDFDRAKKNAESGGETLSEGVLLVYNKMFNILQQRGLKPMESIGASFDPELHEAVTEIPAPSAELKGKVVDTIEKGYWLNDKIIRHAKVVVGS